MDYDLNTKNIEDPKKLIKIYDDNCFDIDELVSHIISRQGFNIHPYSTPGLPSRLLWNSKEELNSILSHKYIDTSLIKNLNESIAYYFENNNEILEYSMKNPKLFLLIAETALCLVSDYTASYDTSSECLGILKEHYQM